MEHVRLRLPPASPSPWSLPYSRVSLLQSRKAHLTPTPDATCCLALPKKSDQGKKMQSVCSWKLLGPRHPCEFGGCRRAGTVWTENKGRGQGENWGMGNYRDREEDITCWPRSTGPRHLAVQSACDLERYRPSNPQLVPRSHKVAKCAAWPGHEQGAVRWGLARPMPGSARSVSPARGTVGCARQTPLPRARATLPPAGTLPRRMVAPFSVLYRSRQQRKVNQGVRWEVEAHPCRAGDSLSRLRSASAGPLSAAR